METVLIDYGAGNLRSAAKGLERMAAETGYGGHIVVARSPERVAAAERIVLPGDGAFGDCMAGVLAVPGLREALQAAVIEKGRPFLGICIGMQLMAERGLEHGRHDGLGWIKGEVGLIERADPAIKIPHMGWNVLDVQNTEHPVLEGLASAAKRYAYFLHSYHLTKADPGEVLATTDHGGPIVAIVGKGNMVGTQFHPEKSQKAGLKLLGNFLKWRP